MGNGIQIEGYREWIVVLKFAWAKKKDPL